MLAMKLRDQGVSLAVNDDRLFVETTKPLTDKQRTFIRTHKPQLIAELKAVTANSEANTIKRLEKIAKERSYPVADLLRWYKDDLPDLGAISDKDFRFVVGQYLDNLDRYKPKNRPHCVKCINCRHFTRTDHPHLGKCAAGVNQSAPAGFWSTHLRGCCEFIETADSEGKQ